MSEPQIHSHETDCLPTDHLWWDKTVMCGGCNSMVHAFNNECMQDWVEWGGLALCWNCALIAFINRIDWVEFKEMASKYPCINGD